MDFLKEFNAIMRDSEHIFISDSTVNIPLSLRATFYYDENRDGVIYFSTQKGSKDMLQFPQINRVNVSVNLSMTRNNVEIVNAEVKKSELTIWDLASKFTDKYPSYSDRICALGDSLNMYEIHFQKATLILNDIEEYEITLV